MYDPSTQQFLQVDPLVGITGQPYSYAGDDPLNQGDPSGLIQPPEGGAGGGGEYAPINEGGGSIGDAFGGFLGDVVGVAHQGLSDAVQVVEATTSGLYAHRPGVATIRFRGPVPSTAGTDEIYNYLKAMNFDTGNEWGVCTRKSGAQEYIEGGPFGIHVPPDIMETIASLDVHVHPGLVPSAGQASQGDMALLKALGQERSILLYRGHVIPFTQTDPGTIPDESILP
jgi:hypothetical protein